MKTAEKDLRNIRKVLNNNLKDFSESIGISEEELIKIEKGERKLTTKELYTICSVLLNTIDTIINPRNDINIVGDEDYKKRIEIKRTFILKMMTDFIGDYHPMNKENRELTGMVTVVKGNEPIDTKRRSKKLIPSK
ncbi:MAG: helix-turn-helix transcriptional regulator [Romboutsia sp.]|nr:helix-turn-helix transcriptional regulator [Romboutsia sp.]